MPSRMLLYGHRGAGGEAPENTMAAFELAKTRGMDGIELDVLRCQSGELVVAHDLTLRRVGNRQHAIKNLNWDRLKKLDVGSHFDPRFHSERIPLLTEVLDAYGNDMLLDIEVKGRGLVSDGIEQQLIQLLNSSKLIDNVILSSFNPIIATRLKKIDPRFKIGYNYLQDRAEFLRRLWFRPLPFPYSMHPPPQMLDHAFINMARDCGAKLMPWAVNSSQDIKQMLQLGVDAILSDFPTRLKDIVAEHKKESLD